MSKRIPRRAARAGRVIIRNSPVTPYARVKAGIRDDISKSYFFRSSWEANIARWFKFQGIKFTYETKTFWFENIKRGVRSYKPDFYLPSKGVFVEVKGWMDARSATKLKRMKKYYPGVTVELIDAKRYMAIDKQCRNVIPHWE